MSYVRVVSLRAGGVKPFAGEKVVRLDRTHPILGNHKFVLKDANDSKERERVIAQFDEALERDMAQNGPMSQEVARLAKEVEAGQPLALQCWCAPKACHLNSVRNAIGRLLKRDVSPPASDAVESPQSLQGSLF